MNNIKNDNINKDNIKGDIKGDNGTCTAAHLKFLESFGDPKKWKMMKLMSNAPASSSVIHPQYYR